MLVFRQMGEEGFDLSHTHFSRMAFCMIKNITPDPVKVGLLSAVGIMLQANGISKLVEKFFGFWGGSRV